MWEKMVNSMSVLSVHEYCATQCGYISILELEVTGACVQRLRPTCTISSSNPIALLHGQMNIVAVRFHMP